MPSTYNQADNEVLHEIRVSSDDADGVPVAGAIIVEVISYKGGESKIQMTRAHAGNSPGSSGRVKLGRVRACEVADLVEALNEAEGLIAVGLESDD